MKNATLPATPRPDPRPPRRWPRLVAGLLALTVALVGVLTTVVGPSSTPNATAAPTRAATHTVVAARHGTGLMINGQWFGTWRVPVGRGFCFEFDKDHPDSRGARALGRGRIPGMSKTETARIGLVTQRYASTRSRIDAAAAAIVVWQAQDTRRFDRYYAGLLRERAIPASVRAAVRRITAESRHHGPYRMTLRLDAGYVGQTVTGVVTVVGADGRGAPGLLLRLRTNRNAQLVGPGQRRSGPDGRATVRVRVLEPGPVRLEARTAAPRSTNVLITRAGAGHQRLVVAGGRPQLVRASSASQRSPGRPTLITSCTSTCDGAAPVTLSMTNPCGSATLRLALYRNGRAVRGGSVDIAGCRTGRVNVVLPDTSVVTTRYCYLDQRRRCTTAPIANPGSLTVDCPPRPKFRLVAECPCDGTKTLRYSLWAPASSPRRFRVSLTLNDRVSTVELVNGRWQNLPVVSVRAGDRLRLSSATAGRTTVLDSWRQE